MRLSWWRDVRGPPAFGLTGDRRLVAQVQVPAHTSEIDALPALLDDLDLEGATVIADVLHAQIDTAVRLVQDHGAHYVLTVKKNQCATRRAGTSPIQTGRVRMEVCWLTWVPKSARGGSDAQRGHSRR